MIVLRGFWALLVVAAVWATVWISGRPVADFVMSCDKTGMLIYPNAPVGSTCASSVPAVVGTWPLIVLGLCLAAPPLIAGVLLRPGVSWLMTTVLVVLCIVGLTQWSDFWGYLLLAGGLAVAAFVLSLLQQLLDFRRDTPVESAGSPRRVAVGG